MMGYYSQIYLRWAEYRGAGGRRSLDDFGKSIEIADAVRGYRFHQMAISDAKRFIENATSEQERAGWQAYLEQHEAELARIECELRSKR